MRVAGGGWIQPHLALYNLFNPALTWNTRVGPAWQTPTRILQSRLLKIGVQMDFWVGPTPGRRVTHPFVGRGGRSLWRRADLFPLRGLVGMIGI